MTVGEGEAHDNTWSVSISTNQAKGLSPDRIAAFLADARAAMAARAEAHRGEAQLRFYAWVDEMAGQLRFSVSSSTTLPFGAVIRVVPDPAGVAAQFLACLNLDGIAWSELTDDSDEDATENEQAWGSERAPIEVYAVDLLD